MTAAEVRKALQARRRETGEDFQRLLERYAIDRFLYRLSKSDHAKTLVLKGAVLFSAWFAVPHRPTRDIDFAKVEVSDHAEASEIVKSICNVIVEDDGLVFAVGDLITESIREGLRQPGIRVIVPTTIGEARIKLQIDIGFGDVITPEPVSERFAPLLDQPAAKVYAYPPETVVAEKLQIIVELGRVNSRMKDYFDLLELVNRREIDVVILASAVRSTFERRGTTIPTQIPDGLSDEFSSDPEKLQQWRAFHIRIEHEASSFEHCIITLRTFAMQVFALAVEL